jgi:hypothetical protein
MPQPLPGAILEGVTPDSRPIFPAAFDVGSARVKTILGPVAALQGSIVYPDAFAYGFVLSTGWDTRGARRGRVTRYLHGLEDTDRRKA